MLFFDDVQLEHMQRQFATSRWCDFDESFLFQPAPRVLKPYDVLRWDGSRFSRATTTDAKFASWIITENSVAHRLSADARHLRAATDWVTAALDTPVWEPQFKGNTDLYHGNLLYALSMFLDLCGRAIDGSLRSRVTDKLLDRGTFAHDAWFANREPRAQRYTQNHFYIPLVGLTCAAIVLDRKDWLDTIRPYPPLIFDALGEDGWFYEGPDYFHYAFVWMIRLAELGERHFAMRDVATRYACFAKLKHFLRWSYFPAGPCTFHVGDASAKEWNYSRWSERESGQKLAPDNWLQNFAHVLYWRGDDEARVIADEIRSRGSFHWYEGFWCLAHQPPSPCTQGEGGGEGTSEHRAALGNTEYPLPNPLPVYREREAARGHFFSDFGIWCADRAIGNRTLRLFTKSGPPMGRSIFKGGQLTYAYDAGHVHPDAGCVLAALDDVPILLGPGYVGRKSTTYQNTLTFDGRGQGDDRIYHALNPGAIDYARWMNVTCTPDADGNGVTLDFAAAYDASLGVERAVRRVRCGTGFQPVRATPARVENPCHDELLLTVEDQVSLSTPRRPEARFRISDPPTDRGEDFVRWRVGESNDAPVFELRVTRCSTAFDLFVQLGEVITMNDDGTRPGGFEAGNVNQRGYQIVLRPRERVTQLEWSIQFSLL